MEDPNITFHGNLSSGAALMYGADRQKEGHDEAQRPFSSL
jgi:hypothetical protein